MPHLHENISPLDNRYSSKIEEYRKIFSESSLINIRFNIEVDWLIFLCSHKPGLFKPLSKNSINKLIKFKQSFNDSYVKKIKKIEEKTNHDVKAVEYFIRNFCLKDKILKNYTHLIHFGLTSEDVNSLSYAIMINEGKKQLIKDVVKLNNILNLQIKKWKSISFLSKTHGQSASPSTLGKEISVFKNRIKNEIVKMKTIKPLAKFSGATGNFHTFYLIDNKTNWIELNKKFIKSFNIDQNISTTQIEPHDWIAELSHSMIRVNNILLDLSQDMWLYISNSIFKLKLNKTEVGSSTMPHKVNPIDFENAEGNFIIANSNLDFIANKLTKSRLQRDLSDSTSIRNIGIGFGYSALAIKSLQKGILKVTPDLDSIKNELLDNWEVLTEAVQTIMRYEGIEDAYEQLKDLSRGNKFDKEKYLLLIESLNISPHSKKKLLLLSPDSYIGIADKLSIK